MIALEAFGSFAWRHWKAILGGVVALGLIVALMIEKGHTRHWKAQTAATQAAFDTTVANYRAAAAIAAKQDAMNVVRVKDEQAKITERVSHDYEADIASARARADALRVRLGKAGSNPGSTATASVPTSGTTASGSDGAPGEEGLSGWSITDRLIATEQAIRLAALQDWVRAQSKVDTTGQPRP